MNTERLQRKFKKLLRDPKGFFKDSKAIPAAIKRDTPELINHKVSHNSIGRIFLNDANTICINFVDSKKPTHQEFSSILIKERKSSIPRNEPIYSNILDNPNNFIGFRDANISLLDAHVNTLDHFLDFKEAFQNKSWLSVPFSEYKNIFLIDPRNNLPSLIKSTSPSIFVHCVFTENSSTNDIERCIRWSGNVDTAILHSSHKDFSFLVNRKHFFSTTAQLLKGISDIILINGSKPYDLLIPCFGNVPFLNNIDDLNEQGHDVYIKINSKISTQSKLFTFEELSTAIAERISFVLCKESIYQRYEEIVVRGDVCKFILATAKDGLRIEVNE
ncbi:hypothetical protein [Aeromonas veronii]|uniref:hypothetical protein n=1 Tax=Aeromonas veronii TaxID=654 RepID=UPI001116BEAB|nr:hypothetical protein [Aeromonas veronii]